MIRKKKKTFELVPKTEEINISLAKYMKYRKSKKIGHAKDE